MYDYAALQSLVDRLEQGSKIHICIAYFQRHSNRKLMVSAKTALHSAPLCALAKERPGGNQACMDCRAAAIQKAVRLGGPYGGYCINGVYEYCHPVFLEDKLFCMIFVGNILRDRKRLCGCMGLPAEAPVLETMEPDLPDETCAELARLVESYIRMLRELTPGTSRAGENHAVISAVKAELDRAFSQPLTLQDMAQMHHYNEKYLGRIFKARLGGSFGEYLNGKRLSYAARLLRKTDESILDISQRAGFNNVTYFNRLFRKKFGRSPSQYRREQG